MENLKYNDESTQNNDAIPIGKEQCLHFDIATHTGYYSVHESGTWNFTESKHRNDNKQHKDFRNTLLSFIKTMASSVLSRKMSMSITISEICANCPNSGDFARSL